MQYGDFRNFLVGQRQRENASPMAVAASLLGGGVAGIMQGQEQRRTEKRQDLWKQKELDAETSRWQAGQDLASQKLDLDRQAFNAENGPGGWRAKKLDSDIRQNDAQTRLYEAQAELATMKQDPRISALAIQEKEAQVAHIKAQTAAAFASGGSSSATADLTREKLKNLQEGGTEDASPRDMYKSAAKAYQAYMTANINMGSSDILPFDEFKAQYFPNGDPGAQGLPAPSLPSGKLFGNIGKGISFDGTTSSSPTPAVPPAPKTSTSPTHGMDPFAPPVDRNGPIRKWKRNANGTMELVVGE